eukprot:3989379-Pyramimonas_sp.AAC.1
MPQQKATVALTFSFSMLVGADMFCVASTSGAHISERCMRGNISAEDGTRGPWEMFSTCHGVEDFRSGLDPTLRTPR